MTFHVDMLLTGTFHVDMVLTGTFHVDMVLTGTFHVGMVLTGTFHVDMVLTGTFHVDSHTLWYQLCGQSHLVKPLVRSVTPCGMVKIHYSKCETRPEVCVCVYVCMCVYVCVCVYVVFRPIIQP